MRDAREFSLRALAGLGLGVSIALLWEYLQGGAGLCAPGGGCDAVRHSEYASLAGIPTPAFGVAFFAVALGLAMTRARGARALLVPVAGAGAIVGVGFLLIQEIAIDAFCAYCVVADVAAILLLPLALLSVRGASPRWPLQKHIGAGVMAVALAAAPLAYGIATAEAPEPAPGLPEPVAEAQREGVVTIVEFVDFQCPYCRAFHESLEQVLPDYEGKVEVVRFHVPLPMHEHAAFAARAAICAENRGKGEAMADQLMAAKTLSAAEVKSSAADLGITEDELLACMKSEETTETIESHIDAAKTAGVEGLPTVYIGTELHRGAKSPKELRASIERALERQT